MTFREQLKYFYLKRLRFLRNRKFIRLSKTSIGGSLYVVACGIAYIQLAAAHEDKKERRTGKDSEMAAAVLAFVSGMGENKLANGKSLQDMITSIEAKADNPDYEQIPGPRPWEMESLEMKEKYLKRAYATVEQNILHRDQRNAQEEDRVRIEIENIKKNMISASEKTAQSDESPS